MVPAAEVADRFGGGLCIIFQSLPIGYKYSAIGQAQGTAPYNASVGKICSTSEVKDALLVIHTFVSSYKKNLLL